MGACRLQHGTHAGRNKGHQRALACRVGGARRAARQSFDAGARQELQRGAEHELVAPRHIGARSAGEHLLQRIDERVRQWIEARALRLFGLRRRHGQISRRHRREVATLGVAMHRHQRADECLDHALEHLGRPRLGHRLCQQRTPAVDGRLPRLEDGLIQLVLGAIVVAHQRERHAGLFGDLADRHAVVAVGGEQLLGCQQDLKPPVRARSGSACARGQPASRRLGGTCWRRGAARGAECHVMVCTVVQHN